MKLYRLVVICLMVFISGCATWNIIGVESVAHERHYQNRESGLEKLRSILESPDSDLNVKVFASFSYAALKLGYLDDLPRNANGFASSKAPSTISIDNNLLSDAMNREEAKNRLRYVVSNLEHVSGTTMISQDDMRIRLSYAYFYLALLNAGEENYDAAFEYLNEFDALVNQYGIRGNESKNLRSEINSKIRANFAAKEEQVRRQEREQQAALRQARDAERFAEELKQKEVKRAERNLPNDEYVSLLRNRSQNKVKYQNSTAYNMVRGFNIDCRMIDWRYIPLENFLLARVDELSREDSWLETSVTEEGGIVRIFDKIVHNNGNESHPDLAFELAGISMYTSRPEAIAIACQGSLGPIWISDRL